MSEATECAHGLEAAWCSICLHGHGSARVVPAPRDTGVADRQGIIDGLAGLCGHPKVVSKGASEPKSLLVSLVRYLGLPVDEASSKPALAQAIVLMAGLEWDDHCDSTSTPSGGGSAITNRGMARLLAASRALEESLTAAS